MPNISPTASDLILFFAHVFAAYIVISISLYNLTKGDSNKELWISLLSSCVGYLLPSPILSNKNVPSSSE